MNEEASPSQSAAVQPAAAPGTMPAAPAARGNALGHLIARMTLTQLTLAVLVIVFAWQWLDAHYQLNQVQQEVARRLSEVEGASKASQALLAQNQELARELGGKLSVLESKFAETQNQRLALEALYQEMSSSRDQTALAEIEQLLLIAGQQLQLSANVKAALIAMQHAESRLQQLNRPAFAELQRRIGRDIEGLRALPDIDVYAINLQLDKLISAVDGLPLAQDARIPAQTAAPAGLVDGGNAWQRFWRELWQEVRGLVRIENTQQQELPLLPPEQTFFLRENLKLRLLSARLALLTHDEASFQHELKTAQAWVRRYFDTRPDETANTLAQLQKLLAARITVQTPDISGSLDAVRNYRAAHERGAK